MDPIVLNIVIVFALILLNGFFALSELAVVSARKTRLQQLASEGSRGARVALRLAEDPDRFLSTVQVGITLVGVFAGAYGGSTLAQPLGDVLQAAGLGAAADDLAITIVVIAITHLSLILGELVPKRVALANAEALAVRVAPFMWGLSRAGAPLVWFLSVSTTGMLWILRLHKERQQTVTEDEVKTLIAEGAEAGVFDPAEREMLESVLRLGDRTARSIMTARPDVIWLDPNDSPDELRTAIGESGHSRFPVAEGDLDHLIGVVQAKDLVAATLQGGVPDLRALARTALSVHEGTGVLRLLDLFRTSPVHMAIVLDEYGSVEGIVTPHDILTALAGDLPERPGEEEPDYVTRADGSLLIEGSMAIDAVERLLNRRDMRGEQTYTTLAGFVLWRLGHLPKTGEIFDWQGLRFEVVDMDGRRVDKVLVAPLVEAETATEPG